MAFLSADTFDPTDDPVIDVMTGGFVWDLSDSRTISWALADGLNGDVWTDRPTAVQVFSDALASFEPFIDVDFDYLGEFASPIDAGEAGADIVYTLDNTEANDGSLAYAYYPGPGVFYDFEQYGTEGGDVFMNFSARQNITSSFAPGSDGFMTVIHELGHALGLKHPFETAPGRPMISDLDQTLVRDVDWFSIMSYDDQYADDLERWDPATPMVLDVLALQYLYGRNTTTNAGDTTFDLVSRDYYYTLWDAGGQDRVDASDQSEGWIIALPFLQVSDLVETRSGFAMPAAQLNEELVESTPTEIVWLMGDMEHAVGSNHADILAGNHLNNRLLGGDGDDELEGNAGDDHLDGGPGLDLARYFGDRSSFTMTIAPDAITIEDRRTDGMGTDSLSRIERVEFYTEQSSQQLDLETFAGPASLSASELESVVELYIAYFNRAPDAPGLNFWATAFDNGLSRQEIAAHFLDQEETRALYSEAQSDADLVTQVYDNVLGRAPDRDGFDFWTDALGSGEVGRDTFILSVLEGARAAPAPDASQAFMDQQNADRAYLETKTDLGALYAVHNGLSDVGAATDALALFDGTEDSVADAVTAITRSHTDALDPDNGAFLMPLVGVLDTPFAGVA